MAAAKRHRARAIPEVKSPKRARRCSHDLLQSIQGCSEEDAFELERRLEALSQGDFNSCERLLGVRQALHSLRVITEEARSRVLIDRWHEAIRRYLGSVTRTLSRPRQSAALAALQEAASQRLVELGPAGPPNQKWSKEASDGLALVHDIVALSSDVDRAILDQVRGRMEKESLRLGELAKRKPYASRGREGREPERLQNAIARDLRAGGFGLDEILEIVSLPGLGISDRAALTKRLCRERANRRREEKDAERWFGRKLVKELKAPGARVFSRSQRPPNENQK